MIAWLLGSVGFIGFLFSILWLGGKMDALTQAIADLNAAITAAAARIAGSATPAQVADAVTQIQAATAAVNKLGA